MDAPEAEVPELDPSLADELLSPALAIWLDRVRANISRTIDAIGGEPSRWRPHVKTAKVPEVMAELAAAGVRAFKCATTREARVLLEELERAGVAADLLVAYPLVGPAALRVADLAREHPRATVAALYEDERGADETPEPLGLFLDVQSGMNRTGLGVDEVARAVALARRAGARLRGVHFYEGEIAGGSFAERRTRAFEAYERLARLLRALERAGCRPREVVTSGTPSFLHALAHPALGRAGASLHRVSPGTVVYGDARTEADVVEIDLEPAALVLSRVVSRPSPDVVTCDAGSKSIAAEAGDPCCRVLGHPGLEALRPSEEHLPLAVHRGPEPERGELLRLFPRHVCPTVNLAERALLIDGADARWVEVAARAHDV